MEKDNTTKEEEEDEHNQEVPDVPPPEEEPEDPLTEEERKTLGTAAQTRVINKYPTDTAEEKLRVPYIEKQNGNIFVKRD